MTNDEIAIRVENLGKRYKLGLTHKGTIRDAIHGFGRRLFGRNGRKKVEGSGFSVQGSEDPASRGAHSASGSQPSTLDSRPSRDFWALRDVSFEVRRGEVLGIIGRNGAGKSTLLKILSQVTKPTTGRAEIRGRVGSLLEVGTGFHPELTGRENVYLNGAILGMTKREIDRKFDEIVDFAGVEKFIDTPVKRYSSGMHVRLGFAVAGHLEPENLVIDEVLAVGDASFQKKCLGKIGDVAKKGRTALFVSHNLGAVRSLCDRAILLERGRIVREGNPSHVISAYVSSNTLNPVAGGEVFFPEDAMHPDAGQIALRSVRLVGPDGRTRSTVQVDEPLRVEISYDVKRTLRGVRVNLQLLTEEGVVAFASTDHGSQFERLEPGTYTSTAVISGGLLNVGSYGIKVSAGIPGLKRLIAPRECLRFVTVGSGSQGSYFPERWPGVVCPRLTWEVCRNS